jgi:preprotein translocase subunit SecA
MDAESIGDVIADMRGDTVASLVAVHCPEGTYPEQWDVAGLKESLDYVLGLDPPVEEWLQEEAIEQEIVSERIQQLADAKMSEKMQEMEPSQWADIEKNILLQTLDHHWKEHLATLDALRAVIHLRSYAQKKPIDEYKQEAFLLFERLLVSIREEVTRILLHAQVQFAQPEAFQLPDFVTQHLDPLSGDDDTADIDPATGAILSSLPSFGMPQPQMPLNNGEPVPAPSSRNALCPCGSGRKYKHCHGQIA